MLNGLFNTFVKYTTEEQGHERYIYLHRVTEYIRLRDDLRTFAKSVGEGVHLKFCQRMLVEGFWNGRVSLSLINIAVIVIFGISI